MFAYVSSVRATVALGISPKKSKYIFDAALLDTGSATLSVIGEVLVAGACVTSATSLQFGNYTGFINEICDIVQTLGTMQFYFCFCFGGRLYCVLLHIVPNYAPLIFSRKDLDEMG